MKTLSQITNALGPPQMSRELRSDGRIEAAIARWSHAGASVDLCNADSFQLIFNISGGQIVELYSHENSSCRSIRAGSIAVMHPGDVESIKVMGKADTLQFLMTRKFIASMTGGHLSAPPSLARCRPQIQAAAAQALVALTRNRTQGAGELDSILTKMARRFAHQDVPRTESFCGGLSMGARRRVSKLIGDRFGNLSDSRLKISELAAAAGLSVHHFIKAFQQSEGETPHSRVITCRIDKALALLLRANVRIDQVAKETGFSSPSHFVSAFRTRLGVTPGAFRDAVHSPG